MTVNVGIVVGEASGDKLAADLVIALKQLIPDIKVYGVIGQELTKAGAIKLYDCEELSIMGLVEPLLKLPKIIKLYHSLIKQFTKRRPDVFIGVDAPDFNLRLEKKLKKLGIPTIHYVSPTLWAWRSGRIKLIKQAVDLMLTLLPFEKKFYDQHQQPSVFVGHPFADRIKLQSDNQQSRKQLKFNASDQVLAILPGSRKGELRRLAALYLQVANICQQQSTQLKFVMPLVNAQHAAYIEQLRCKYTPDLQVTITYDMDVALSAADFALVTSGTATLEAMLHKKPMIVAYKTNWLTYHIVKCLIKVKYISLPNLLADMPLVPEYIQQQATVQTLSAALVKLIKDGPSNSQLQTFTTLHKKLAQKASNSAATAVLQLLEGKRKYLSTQIVFQE